MNRFGQMAAARLVRLVRTLWSTRSGVAYIEFAYSLPILMFLSIFGVELANIAITNARVSSITSMMADGAARVRDRIDEADINELMAAAKMAGEGIDLTKHGRVVVTSIEDNGATTTNTTDQLVTWQRCKGEKVPASGDVYGSESLVLNSGIGPTGRQISAPPGNAVVFAQIIYQYQPIFSNRLFGPITIRYSSAFTVRDRALQAMQNGSGLAASAKATCNFFTA